MKAFALIFSSFFLPSTTRPLWCSWRFFSPNQLEEELRNYTKEINDADQGVEGMDPYASFDGL
jgi:hypothetical protein